MDSLFHFVFPIIAALAARLKIKHQIKTLLSLATITVLMDMDHISPVWERALLHNVFVTIALPLILLFLAFHFKLDRYKKGFLLLLLIFLSSHVMLDVFTNSEYYAVGIKANLRDGVALFYPFSNLRYSADFNVMTPSIIPIDGETKIVTTEGFGILLFFIMIILPCLFLDDIIEISERRHERPQRNSSEA